ncbi:MAG: DUF885 domain-containing protein [Kangiellaceae bacterium]|nr:DUF885 domain-containing protein [Kangiellaceae bacterium]
MRKLPTFLLSTTLTALLASCGQQDAPVPVDTQPASANMTSEKQMTESEKANALFETIFMEGVMRSPMFQSFLGIKKDQDKWDDLSEERALQNLQVTKDDLAKVNQIDASMLDAQTKVSLDIMKLNLEQEIADFKWRFHNYPLNQMFGIHSQVPSLLINQHTITDLADAEAYISRLEKVAPLFDQVIDGINTRAEKGIIAPKFVYPYVISDSENIVQGAPFTEGDDSTLLADFSNKLTQLDLDDLKRDELIKRAKDALRSSVKPGFEKLIAAVKVIQSKADDRDGAWKLPDGEAFFNNALARTTSTSLTAKEIHQIGLDEVARIHDEMKLIKDKVGFKDDLAAFFEFMRNDVQFYYPESEQGKQQYLTEATQLINTMKSRLDELFIVKPKADLTVKAVESFREKSAGKAFYQSPSLDGTRPGIYYANLYRMSDMPTYQMEALAYHEGIPGHHMQRAIALELEGLPKFRKFSSFTAYTEGWGLYSEFLPKEIGMYSDPYSDFGRLAMELWRACRLVVDTGIHAMKWDREKGIEYYVTNTPNPQPDAVKMVERHIVMPSQATAYKIGMLKILELRTKAETIMGDKFDIREFHEVVLKNGPVPLSVLSQYIDDYIASK